MARSVWILCSAATASVVAGASCLVALAVDGPSRASWQAAAVSPPRAIRVVLPRVEVVEVHRAADADAGYYARLRARLQWVQAKVGDRTLLTPDLDSRLLLAKSAAKRAGLDEVGLGFRDVYGLINAETSWVPRQGASKDGTPNLGIAQFEPATAQALGLRDPNDPVEAVHAAALHMKDAALWSRERIAGLKLSKAEREERLREGVSIYYNLSTKRRNTWNGRNTDELPVETRRHIANARLGAEEAAMFDAMLRAGAGAGRGRAVLTARAGDLES